MANVKPTSSGSGIGSKGGPVHPHLLSAQHPGVEGEVAKLRADLAASRLGVAALAVDEWAAPATGSVLLLGSIPKARAGATLIIREVVDGAVVTTGSLGQTSGVWHYTPATAPNGVHNYAIYYEMVGS